MASGHDQRRKQGVQKPDFKKDGKKPDEEELEQLEEGQDLSAEQAQRLQPQLGNQAVQALMARMGSGRGASAGGVDIEHEEEEVIAVEEEGPELESPEVGGGGGGGSGDDGSGAPDPWDIGLLFGGDDDDDENPLAPARRRAWANMQRLRAGSGRAMRDEAEELGLLTDDDLAPADELLAHPPPLPDERRLGDAVYAAVEPALQDPRTIGRNAWAPEDLVDRTGVSDPLGRPALVGRFLDEAGSSARTRSLARVLGGPSAALLTAVGGHAGAVARLSSLAVCCEALEGGGRVTDRGVAVALVGDAWPAAVVAARAAASKRRLHAPEIARIALEQAGLDPSEPHDARHLPRPSRLGGRGLAAVISAGFVPPVPSLHRPDPPAPPADDEEIAAIDAMMARLMGDSDPTTLPPDPVLDWRTLEPILSAAEGLVNAMGRAQVELAAAALAVRRVRSDAPVRQILIHSDRALRELARDVVGTGESLKAVENQPMSTHADLARNCVEQLRSNAASLVELRQWAFENLAGAMDV